MKNIPFTENMQGLSEILEPKIKFVLGELGMLGLATEGQLNRIMYLQTGWDLPEEMSKLLSYSVNNQLIGSRSVNIPSGGKTKIRSGRNAMTHTRIYYLMNRGLSKISGKKNDERAFYIVGSPNGIRKQRIYHDLLITEAYIWFLQHYEVTEFYNENKLKSENAKRGTQLPTGDFRIIYNLKENTFEGNFSAVDCEVTIQSTRKQIEQKPDGMFWFTSSERTADIIESTKSAIVTILGDVRRKSCQVLETETEVPQNNITSKKPGKKNSFLPAKVSTEPNPKTASVRLENNLVKVLRSSEIALTASALAALTGKDRACISKILTQLERRKVVTFASVHLTPGKTKGTPSRLFSLNLNQELKLLNLRRHFLLLSNLIVASIKKKFTIGFYDSKNGVLGINIPSKNAKIYALIDDFYTNCEEKVNKLLRFESVKIPGNENVVWYLVPGTLEQSAEIKSLYKQIRVIDLLS